MKQQEKNGPAAFVPLLRTNALLRNLTDEQIYRIASFCEEDVWPRKTCNISKARIFGSFHMILSGRMKMYRVDPESGREFTLFLLKKNDVFDVIRLLNGTGHEVFYETIDKVHLLSLPNPLMLDLLKEIPAMNQNLLPYLAGQMRCLEEYAANLTLADISKRLARLLLNNINENSRELENINDLSNEELANLIGSTRAVVNRHLQEFKAEGIVSLGRESLRVNDPQLLLHKAYPGIEK
ncbi:MAG: Crp/Fnr family transcriptional regulator [Salinimicrobium sp.]